MSSLWRRLLAWMQHGYAAMWPPPKALPAPTIEPPPTEPCNAPQEAHTEAPAPPKAKPRAKSGPKRPRRETARLKADVLDQLGRYQVYIKRLKRWDKEAFAQYRRIGAFVMTGDINVTTRELEPVFLKTLPGFGAVAIGMINDDETRGYLPGRFCYFMKLKRPGHDVERVNAGTTYRFQIYWDEESTAKWTEPDSHKRQWERRGHGFSGEWLVNIADDGKIRALRVLKNKGQVIRHKNGYTSTVHHQLWGLPKPPHGMNELTQNPAQAICGLFAMIMNFWVAASYNSMIRVTATKDGIVMPFIVDATDTPQFFADREPVVVDGVKKRVFHIVRAHARNTAKGTKGVKLHFAGLRRFKWNDYDIQITVPGKDHIDIAEFNVGAMEDVSDEEIAAAKHLDYFEIADWLADHIDAPAKLPREQVEGTIDRAAS